jgi:hypothetical protein
VVSFTPRPSYLQTDSPHPVPIGLEAAWATELVWTRCRKEKFPFQRVLQNISGFIISELIMNRNRSELIYESWTRIRILMRRRRRING